LHFVNLNFRYFGKAKDITLRISSVWQNAGYRRHFAKPPDAYAQCVRTSSPPAHNSQHCHSERSEGTNEVSLSRFLHSKVQSITHRKNG
jgi:hypothetical protein